MKSKYCFICFICFIYHHSAFSQCNPATFQGVFNLTTTTADPTISNNGGGSNYIEYGLPGFSPGTGSTAGVGGTLVLVPGNQNFVTITGLTPYTSYQAYTRKNCSGTWSINSTVYNFGTAYNCSNSPVISCSQFVALSIPSGSGAWFGTSGKEAVYKFTPAIYGNYQLVLTGLSNNNQAAEYYFKKSSLGCSESGFTFIGSSSVSGPYSFMFGPLDAGTEYYIMANAIFANGSVSTFNIFGCPTSGCGTPASFTTTNITSSSVTFNWQSVVNATNYNVRYRIVGSGIWTTTSTTTTTKTITGLNYGSNYEWQVSAYCNNGGGAWSAFSVSNIFTTLCALPTTIISPGGIMTICWDGQSLFAYPSLQGPLSIQWQFNGADIPGEINNVYYVSGSASSAGNYAVKFTTLCGSYISAPVTIVGVYLPPPASITAVGPTIICNGGNVQLDAFFSSDLTYQWLFNGNYINGATSASYAASQAGDYKVKVTDVVWTGCTNESNTITVTVGGTAPFATITPSGPTTICSGNVVLNANTGTGLTYQWKNNGTNIAGATLASYTATASGSYTVVVTATGGCSATSAATVVTIGVLSAAVTPSGTVTLCSGTSTTLSATAGSGYTYKWYRNNVLLSTTTQTFTTSTAGTYKCVVTSGSCTATSNNVVVVVNTTPNATVSYSTPLTFCSPGSVTFTANALSGAAYQWENNSIAIPGATSQTYVATGAGVYRVKETKNGCVDYSSTRTVTTATSVTAAITTADPVTQCTGGVVNISVTSPVPGYSHQWKKNNVNIAGATGTTYQATTTGSYTVTATAGCGTATSNAITVTIGSVSAVVSPAASATLCTGGSVLLTANTGSGFTHQWKKNNVNIAGATTSTYTVTTAGSYTVAITAPCGSATSAATVVTQAAVVTASVTPTDASTVCSGSSITFTANAGAGYTYKWYRNNVLLSNTTQTFTTGTAGSYKVEVSISGSCAVQSNTVTLTAINNPTPTITAGGPTTFCAGQSVTFTSNAVTGAAYQWQKNSVNIAGATAQTYTATTAGSYRVQQTKSGCSKYSSKKTVTVNCRLGDETSEEISSDETNSTITMEVYPNPFATSATIEIRGSLKINNATIEIYNLLGDIVKRITNVNSKTTTIEKEKMNAGVYHLLWTNGDGQTLNTRFVVN